MNRTILAVVSIIALLYSGLCFFLTLTNYVTGAGHPIDIYLFLPINGDLGINITDKLMEYVTYLSSGLYDQIISGIASLDRKSVV